MANLPLNMEAIRQRLMLDFSGVQGLNRLYFDYPNVQPEAADCPALIIGWREPSVTTQGSAGEGTYFNLNFLIKVLVNPLSLEMPSANITAAEDFIQPLASVMGADFSGGGLWDTVNKDDLSSQFHLPIVDHWGNLYYGLTWDLTIMAKDLTIVFSAGS